ncbi:MAG: glyA, partial [Candidatus Kaiserbacteria bacterium]|nr:glyA [Candidatus Kaiserbacteria bacterium]
RENAEIAKKIDRSVFPGFQGGPIMSNIAGKAVAFGEALKPSFKVYAKQIIKNAKAMENVFHTHNIRMITGGTSNHLILADVFGSLGITGHEAETLLDEVGITLNKNMIADDPRKPMDPSGIRFGTPAITTRGFKEKDCARVAELMIEALTKRNDKKTLKRIREDIRKMSKKMPIPQSFV